MHSHYTALLDSCVLYPAQIRDLLLTLSYTGLYRARWTDRIHDEWIDAVLRNRPDLDRAKLARTRRKMDEAGHDSLVTGYEDLIEAVVLPDPKDRHVLAAAIQANADAIVTFNLRDFPVEALSKYGIEAQHPDEFVLHQISLSQESAFAAIASQRARLLKPPRSVREFIDALEPFLPKTAALLRTRTAFL